VHSCGRTRGGDVYCWGRNTYGQVGDGSTNDHFTPVRIAGGGTFASITASGAHTCAVTPGGESHCWGYNVAGQLGDGTRSHQARPVRVTLSDQP
jgi:alpha-tubulin suppressor-like RCC1 family protein